MPNKPLSPEAEIYLALVNSSLKESRAEFFRLYGEVVFERLLAERNIPQEILPLPPAPVQVQPPAPPAPPAPVQDPPPPALQEVRRTVPIANNEPPEFYELTTKGGIYFANAIRQPRTPDQDRYSYTDSDNGELVLGTWKRGSKRSAGRFILEENIRRQMKKLDIDADPVLSKQRQEKNHAAYIRRRDAAA